MGTAVDRDHPYVWATWLAKYLAGEQDCEWSFWFRAHRKHQKVMSGDFDLAKWNADHSALMTRRREELERAGYSVKVESQNQFRVRGQAGTLAGKMDLVGLKPSELLIVDGKTGKQRNSDWFQVLIYLWVARRAWPSLLVERIPRGEVLYATGDRIPVYITDLTPKREAEIAGGMRRLCGGVELVRRPSASACGFCDIGPSDCPDRIEQAQAAVAVGEW